MIIDMESRLLVLILLVCTAIYVCATDPGERQLFAVVGGNACATGLFYGPQNITEAGSTDGKHPYYLSTSTLSNDVPHTEWLQIVTSDGSNELFRIFWSFVSAKTLAERFIDAVWYGEDVKYRIEVHKTGESILQSGNWRFSSGYPTSIDLAPVRSMCGFSSGNAAWGAGQEIVDGSGTSIKRNRFWGIGSFDSIDTVKDSAQCHRVYQDGVSTHYAYAKAYMYYFAPLPTDATVSTSTTKPAIPV